MQVFVPCHQVNLKAHHVEYNRFYIPDITSLVDIQEDYLKWFLSKAEIVSTDIVSIPGYSAESWISCHVKWLCFLLCFLESGIILPFTGTWLKDWTCNILFIWPFWNVICVLSVFPLFLCRATFPQWTYVPTRSYWTLKPRQPCCKQMLNCKCRYLL